MIKRRVNRTEYTCSVCGRKFNLKDRCLKCEDSHNYTLIRIDMLPDWSPADWKVQACDPSWAVLEDVKVGEIWVEPRQLSDMSGYRRVGWCVIVPKDRLKEGRLKLYETAMEWLSNMMKSLKSELNIGDKDELGSPAFHVTVAASGTVIQQ